MCFLRRSLTLCSSSQLSVVRLQLSSQSLQVSLFVVVCLRSLTKFGLPHELLRQFRFQLRSVLKVVQERSRVSPAIRGRVPPPQKFFKFIFDLKMASFDALLGAWYFMRFTAKQETRYRPGKTKEAGSPTLATRPHSSDPAAIRSPIEPTARVKNRISSCSI